MPTMTASAVALDAEDTFAALAADNVDRENQVARAGLPVIERLAEDLGDLAISIELTDERANVVGRVVGANTLAATLHWSGASVAAPITDPRRDMPVGAVAVTCASPDASALMLPYAQLAARTISERIVDAAAVADRELLEQFLRARRRARGPILAVNSQELLTNAAAAGLVQPDDHARIWSWALGAVESSEPSELELGGGTVAASCEPVRVGGKTVGVIVHLEELTAAASAGRRGRRAGRPTLGWESLRSSELGIADLVAEGLTNREIAARIFVSPHTVDFHLRQIYRKLSITSRIGLTRLVLEHATTSSRTAVLAQ
jgi:DNA-binding CsgD family transcriptional regulator